MGGDRIYRLVKESCAAAGLEPHRFAPHSFRSGVITQSATNGVAIQYLQQLARHSSIATTGHYVRQAEDPLGEGSAAFAVAKAMRS
jgi:site-specific recombinase XerD